MVFHYDKGRIYHNWRNLLILDCKSIKDELMNRSRTFLDLRFEELDRI
jgi:hypothetical protein